MCKKIMDEYVVGMRVELDFMDDVMSPPKGTRGTVKNIDANGVLHVSWDNGCFLGLIPNVDMFHIVEDD